MSIDPKFVELTADVVRIILIKYPNRVLFISGRNITGGTECSTGTIIMQ